MLLFVNGISCCAKELHWLRGGIHLWLNINIRRKLIGSALYNLDDAYTSSFFNYQVSPYAIAGI